MGITGFILDKANDGTVVVYSITPSTSFALKTVINKGASPLFLISMAATALNQHIVTYSYPDGGDAYFNSFDTTTGTWSGPKLTLQQSPTPTPTSTSSPGSEPKSSLGTIIGGAIGGLAVFAIALAFFIRHRRQGYHKAGTDKPQEDNNADSPDKEHQHPNSYIPPPPLVKSFESNSMEPSPHGPQYVSPTSFRESTVSGSNPQYIDPNAPISDPQHEPCGPQIAPTTPPQRHPHVNLPNW
ncbi:hypothetical protein BGX33_001586 [Mortierella sp. NVP41]|nr:hypothetical protein BGX33_001586 [Mortierella sp. NVP41]